MLEWMLETKGEICGLHSIKCMGWDFSVYCTVWAEAQVHCAIPTLHSEPPSVLMGSAKSLILVLLLLL